MNKLITMATVLALIGLASVGTASAQTTNFNAGDLILDFRLNNVTSTGTSLEYDLGPGASFNFGTTNASIVNLSSALNTVYGSSWASNSNLVYSIVGADSYNNGHALVPQVFLDNPGNAGTYTVGNSIATSGLTGNIEGIYTPVSGTLETGGAYAIAQTSGNSYYFVLTNGTSSPYSNDYNYIPGSIGTTETTLGNSVDLYNITSNSAHPTVYGASTDEGTFEVGTNGVLSFTSPAAVPEPASYVLGGIAAVLFVIMHRRSKIRA